MIPTIIISTLIGIPYLILAGIMQISGKMSRMEEQRMDGYEEHQTMKLMHPSLLVTMEEFEEIEKILEDLREEMALFEMEQIFRNMAKGSQSR